MTRIVSLAACCLLVSVAGAFGSGDVTGEWTVSEKGTAARVQISFTDTSNVNRPGKHHLNTSSEWDQSELQGLDLTNRSKHDVHFTVRRDAGVIQGEGFAKDGQGAGLFTFRPDRNYPGKMAELGFRGIDEERQLAFALHDVRLQFARDMKAMGIQGLSADKLLACRILGVSPAYIRELGTAGVKNDRDQ